MIHDPETQGEIPWEFCAEADPVAAVANAVPHRTVSQVVRPDVAAFLPPRSVLLRSFPDAQRCVTSFKVVLRAIPRDPAIDMLARLPLVSTVDVAATDADAAFLARVAKLPQRITALDLHNCDSIGQRADFAAFPELRSLDISGCTFGAALSPLRGPLPELHTLTFDAQKVITQAQLHLIGELRQLHTLSLSGCRGRLDTSGFVGAGRFQSLRCLCLRGCQTFLSGSNDATNIAQLSGMRSLDVSFGLHLDADTLGILAQLRLESLNIRQCSGVTAAGLAHVGRMTSLRVLDVSRCRKMDGEGLRHVARLAGLRNLNVASCPLIDGSSFMCLACLADLEVLDLSFNRTVDGAVVAALRPLRLRTLILRDCPGSGVP